MSETQGQCLCGDITFQVTGEPVMQGNCHCTDCKRATGASYATIAFFKTEQFTLLSGTPKRFAHETDSGSQMTKTFCPNCGSLLFGSNSRREGVVSVYVGSLEQPSWLQPQFNVWTSRAFSCTPLDPEVVAFEKGKS